MIDILKLNHTKDKKFLVFSDTHYNHDRDFIWGARGFKNVQESNAVQIERWNKKVSNNDTVMHLGDIIFGEGAYYNLLNLLDMLNFSKLYVMPGNHTSGYRQLFHKVLEASAMDNYYRLTYKLNANKEVHLIPNYYEMYVNGQAITMSHYPVLAWNGIAKGAWMLFGHCHNNLTKTDWVRDNYLVGKCLDMGTESINGPMDFDEIKTFMDQRPSLEMDHHLKNSSVPFVDNKK